MVTTWAMAMATRVGAMKRVMARAAREVAMTTKWAMAMETTWVTAMATRVKGNKEGNDKEEDKGSKGNGDGDEGGGQATATTWAMATGIRWQATKRAIKRAARATGQQ
jgi:hypothetical protein